MLPATDPANWYHTQDKLHCQISVLFILQDPSTWIQVLTVCNESSNSLAITRILNLDVLPTMRIIRRLMCIDSYH
jgi:hypothetical protein